MPRFSMEMQLGSYQSSVKNAKAEALAQKVMPRILKHDHTVWKDDPTEISNRLGWLHIPRVIQEDADRLKKWAKSIGTDGFTHALLLGMGGSSLAPEVFRKVFGVREGYLDLSVLDSTDPSRIKHFAETLPLERTLFIVSTKSGSTVETRAFFTYFFNLMRERLGFEHAGRHYIAITDPGSDLEKIGKQLHFRDIILNAHNIGGRFSALSYFGMAPASLMGIDIQKILGSATAMMETCQTDDNPGLDLGVALGKLAKAGRDKLTFLFSPEIESYGDWVEQLIAESTGKESRVGILPVVGESPGDLSVYSDDRVFVHMRLRGDHALDETVKSFQNAGHPVIRIRLSSPNVLGGQFFLWELATAIAGEQLRINPFDQPHVQSAKTIAKEKVESYRETRENPRGAVLTPSLEALNDFLYQARPGDYVSLQAFVPPEPETDRALETLRLQIRRQTKLAVTVGYGPRFLHSTGQLHKGDSGKGLFIQFISDLPEDDPGIPDLPDNPDASITFGILRNAQALGDFEALLNAERRAIRFDLGKNVPAALAVLTE